MAYAVRCSRDVPSPGRYTFTYGKAGKKLSLVVWYNDIAKRWQAHDGGDGADLLNTGPATKLLREAKDKWGRWAEAKYNGTTPSGPPSIKSPAVAAPVGPPRVGGVPPKVRRNAPDLSTENEYVADPFDPALTDREGKLTTLGALDEVWSWVKRNSHRCTHPATGNLGYPWLSVQTALQRALPDRPQYRSLTDDAKPQAPKLAAVSSGGPPAIRPKPAPAVVDGGGSGAAVDSGDQDTGSPEPRIVDEADAREVPAAGQ